MKHILTAALALALLSGTAAIAKPDDPPGASQSEKNKKQDADKKKADNKKDKDAVPSQPGTQAAPAATPANSAGWTNPVVRPGKLRWSRGDRLPDQYRQSRYFVDDWQQHGLRRPPRGYRWVRNDDNDFFLALLVTGVIIEVVSHDDRNQRWRTHYSRTYTYNDDVYYRECRTSPDPAGVLVGGLIGGLIGNAAGHGGTGATVAGVIFGGALGAALTSDMDCEDRSYAYRSYYDGFNYGRAGRRYAWSNPHNNHHGYFRVGRYYNDPYGFRCASFTQTIYIKGRARVATGRACRQPDGAWTIVN